MQFESEMNPSLKRSLVIIVRALKNCFQGIDGVYFLLCDEDLAKGGRFWINMFARRFL